MPKKSRPHTVLSLDDVDAINHCQFLVHSYALLLKHHLHPTHADHDELDDEEDVRPALYEIVDLIITNARTISEVVERADKAPGAA